MYVKLVDFFYESVRPTPWGCCSVEISARGRKSGKNDKIVRKPVEKCERRRERKSVKREREATIFAGKSISLHPFRPLHFQQPLISPLFAFHIFNIALHKHQMPCNLSVPIYRHSYRKSKRKIMNKKKIVIEVATIFIYFNFVYFYSN